MKNCNCYAPSGARIAALERVAKAAQSAIYAKMGGDGGPRTWAYPELREALEELNRLS